MPTPEAAAVRALADPAMELRGVAVVGRTAVEVAAVVPAVVRAAVGVVGGRDIPGRVEAVPAVVVEVGFFKPAAAMVAEGATLDLARTGVDVDVVGGRTPGRAAVVPARGEVTLARTPGAAVVVVPACEMVIEQV